LIADEVSESVETGGSGREGFGESKFCFCVGVRGWVACHAELGGGAQHEAIAVLGVGSICD